MSMETFEKLDHDRRQYDLKDLTAGITENNLHKEVEW
jgi:hypothetical protein